MPEDSVSPTPRSKIRALTVEPWRRVNETLVRFGNSRLRSISGPILARSSCSTAPPTSITHCGLPIETWRKSHSRPPASSVPRPSRAPEGKSGDAVAARPISIAHSVADRIAA